MMEMMGEADATFSGYSSVYLQALVKALEPTALNSPDSFGKVITQSIFGQLLWAKQGLGTSPVLLEK